MDVQRIWILLGKDVRLGATNFLSIYVLVVPVVLSLLIALVFGDLFAQTPRLGIYDAGGNADLAQQLLAHKSINTRIYGTEEALLGAVERGTVEVGLSLPTGYAQALESGTSAAHLTYYRWGEAGARNLILLESAVKRTFLKIMGYSIEELPVKVNVEQLGKASTATWSQRLLPLILIMSIVLGGLFIPAASLLEERQKRTLMALTTTPTSLLDVYLSKVLLGTLLCGIMAVIVLQLNGALSGHLAALLIVIALGGIMSALLGVILGSVSRDMDTFIGIIKVLGIVLYAPGILQIFPQVPDWIGRIFPTYYLMNPLIEISQNGSGFTEVASDILVMVALIAVMLFALSRVMPRQHEQMGLEV